MSANFKNLDVEKIHKAFSPATEIRDPKQFVGRRQEIQAGIGALLNPGGFLPIFGLRGVGKTSIAYQLKLIAEGNQDLPKTLNLEKQLPKHDFNYIVHYIRSDSFIKNVPILLKRILFGDDENSSLFTLTKAGDKKLVELRKAFGGKGEAGALGVKINLKSDNEETYIPYISDDLIQQFRQLLGTIRKDNNKRSGLLILIDEFDPIPDKTGFASIVKACSSDYVKFGIVGIATSITELLQDHGSIGRQIDSIHVPLMPPDELMGILRRAEFWIGDEIGFEEKAKELIVQISEGFPYFTHLLGKEAMMLAFARGSKKVTEEDIDQLGRLVVEGRLKTIYEEIYQGAVKHSPQREVLLKAFAENEKDEIYTEPVFSLTKELGITNPSQLMKELTAPQGGSPILIKVRERYYRFSDPVFKVYARIRQWKF